MRHPFKFIITSIILCLSFLSNAQEISDKETSGTFYFIRHAEKERSNPKDRNPHLTKNGQTRAENWAHFFKDIPLKAIYSSNYHRTIETATPTAAQKGLEVLTYDPSNLDPSPFLEKFPKDQVLIVGHSNTTPAFVNAFLNEVKYKDLDDADNGSIFVLQITNGVKLVNQYHID